MLRTRTKIGKFVVTKRIVDGVYAAVYRARDTITGTDVALKVPHERYGKGDDLEDFRREVRVAAGLDHPNILPVREAGFAEDVFYIACPLGSESLADRMQRRLSAKTMLSFADQMLAGLAYAHSKRVMHCDVKPENFIIFPDNQIKLADFGIAKIALRTIHGSGSGTVGYLAPEQALGRPSLRSDVFAMGLVIYRMLSGVVPQWPFNWPPPGIEKARRIARPPLLDVLRRSMEVDTTKRYADAGKMHAAFRKIRSRAIVNGTIRTKTRRVSRTTNGWRGVRQAEFLRRYRKALEVKDTCTKCDGPMAENMLGCPWCGTKRKAHEGGQRFRESCPRCKRSVKTDWRFCPHCYGRAINPEAEPRFSDRRYEGRCDNAKCAGRELMPFMQYCPWCRRKVRKRWRIEGASGKCRRCEWDVLPDYWEYCPWCVTAIRKR